MHAKIMAASLLAGNALPPQHHFPPKIHRPLRLHPVQAAPAEGSGGMPLNRAAHQSLSQPLPGYDPSSLSAAKPQAGQPNHPGAAAGGANSRADPAAASQASTSDLDSWESWTQLFNSLECTLRELSALDEELQVAVREENYSRAAAVHAQQKRLAEVDTVGAVLDELHAAVQEERYEDAAALREAGAVGIEGWWAGRGEDDPFGHLIHVTPDFARYVAHPYTGPLLAELSGWTDTASAPPPSPFALRSSGAPMEPLPAPEEEDMGPGLPVFELFLRRDPETGALLQRVAAVHDPDPVSGVDAPAAMDQITELLAQHAGQDGAEVSVEQGMDESGVGFVRINVTSKIDATDGTASGAEGDDEAEDDDAEIHTVEDLLDMIELGEVEEISGEHFAASAEAETSSGGLFDDEGRPSPAEDMVDAWVETEVDGKLRRMRLGDAFQLADAVVEAEMREYKVASSEVEDEPADGDGDTLSSMGMPAMPHRVPADLEWLGRDAFAITVPTPPGAGQDQQVLEPQAALQQQQRASSSSGEGIGTGQKVFLSAGAGNADEVENLLRGVVNDMMSSSLGALAGPSGMGLSGRVSYQRLDLSDPSTDPLSGIYLGTFGPHGPEVLRVSRVQKNGEEWVQAVKLTGDRNVPAGKVTFRARIGRDNRLSTSGSYPPEYGVQQRYKGQGRVAREGYSAAKWVEGELLTLSATNPVTRGAELGFVYNMDSGHKYLCLFSKLHLNQLAAQLEGTPQP